MLYLKKNNEVYLQRFGTHPKTPSLPKVLLTLVTLLLLVALGFYFYLKFSSVGKMNRASKKSAELPYAKVGDSAPKSEVNEQKVPPPRDSTRDQFTLEVQAFSTRSEADSLVESLASRSINAYYTPLQTADGRVIYRVRLGLFPSLAMAEKVSVQIRKEQNITNQVVKLQ